MNSPKAFILAISKVKFAKNKQCKECKDEWCAEIPHLRSESN